MLVYHFVRIPELPPDVRHQSNFVEIVEYLAAEDRDIGVDTPILRVRNWWAEMEILSGVDGHLVTTIFKGRICVGGSVNVGDPVALVLLDPEDQPKNREIPTLRITKRLHEKPKPRRREGS